MLTVVCAVQMISANCCVCCSDDNAEEGRAAPETQGRGPEGPEGRPAGSDRAPGAGGHPAPRGARGRHGGVAQGRVAQVKIRPHRELQTSVVFHW